MYRAALQNQASRPANDPAAATRRPAARLPGPGGPTPWKAESEKKRLNKLIEDAVAKSRADYHASFVAALGEQRPANLRELLPAAAAPIEPVQNQLDAAAQAKQWKHEVAQNSKSIAASQEKVLAYQSDIDTRTTRNQELKELLAKHALELSRLDLAKLPDTASQEAALLNSRLEEHHAAEALLRRDLAAFEAKQREPAPLRSAGLPPPSSCASSEAGDMDFDFEAVDDSAIDELMSAIAPTPIASEAPSEETVQEGRKRCRDNLKLQAANFRKVLRRGKPSSKGGAEASRK